MKINIKEWDEIMRKSRDKERIKDAIIRYARRDCYPAAPNNALIAELSKRYFDDTLPKEIRDEIDEIKERRKPCVRWENQST